MIVGMPLSKQPSEIFPFGVTFASELGTGESVVSAVFRAVKDSDGSDATAALKVGYPVVGAAAVTQTIQAGTHGENYMLELTATTSLGHVWQAERRLIVRDLPVPAA